MLSILGRTDKREGLQRRDAFCDRLCGYHTNITNEVYCDVYALCVNRAREL